LTISATKVLIVATRKRFILRAFFNYLPNYVFYLHRARYIYANIKMTEDFMAMMTPSVLSFNLE